MITVTKNVPYMKPLQPLLDTIKNINYILTADFIQNYKLLMKTG